MHHRLHITSATTSGAHGNNTNSPDVCERSNNDDNRNHNHHLTWKKYARKRMFYHYHRNEVKTCLTLLIGVIVLILCGIWIGVKIAQSSISNEIIVRYDQIPFNSKYIIPGSHKEVGDRSDRYVLLRKEYDEMVEDDPERSLQYVQNWQQRMGTFDSFPFDAHHSDQLVPYDIHNCPNEPPPGYPLAWNAMEVLENWPVNDVTQRPTIYQGLCIFDYQKDYDKAMNYRNWELPFVVKNDPNIAKVVERWNSPNYMENMLGDTLHRTEYSENNHFMYSVPLPRKKLKRRNFPNAKNWKPPTEMLRMTYQEWLQNANATTAEGGKAVVKPDDPHWYFRLIGCGGTGRHGECDKGSSEYLFDELPFFQPREGTLYIKEPTDQRGIHCRFGMDGVIAENHFDAARNTIVVLGGSRRYLLSHPDQCESLVLYPKKHPSARHSQVDWSNPDLEAFPQFSEAMINEVVLQAGDAMYLPTHWFHYIVSLELNFQCNTRSGFGYEYVQPIQQCGFDPPSKY